MFYNPDFLTKEQKEMKQVNFRITGIDGLRQKNLIGAARKEQSPEVALDIAPSFYKTEILKKWWPYLELEKKKTLLHRAWKFSDLTALFGYDQWLKFFDETGFISNCGIPRPIEPAIVYRGCTPGFRNGMSWTPEIEVAKWFNERFEDPNGISRVYKTEIQPEWILAVIKGDKIDTGEVAVIKGDKIDTGEVAVVEYVVDPRFLDLDSIYEINLFQLQAKLHQSTGKFFDFPPYLKLQKNRGYFLEMQKKRGHRNSLSTILNRV